MFNFNVNIVKSIYQYPDLGQVGLIIDSNFGGYPYGKVTFYEGPNLFKNIFDSTWKELCSNKHFNIPMFAYKHSLAQKIKSQRPDIPIYNYNLGQDTLKLTKKTKFYIDHYNCDFIPPFVTSKEAVLKNKFIKFPVIAKKDTGHSGLGIKKLNNRQELEEFGDQFDLFMNEYQILKEFRYVVYKGEVFAIFERIPIDIDLDKNIDEKVKFGYKLLYNYFFKYRFDEITNIVKYNSHWDIIAYFTKFYQNKIDYFSIDIAIVESAGINKYSTNENNIVFEINLAPGNMYNLIHTLYPVIFNEHYKRPLSKFTLDMIKETLWQSIIERAKYESKILNLNLEKDFI